MQILPPRSETDPNHELEGVALRQALLDWQRKQAEGDSEESRKPWYMPDDSEYYPIVDEGVRELARTINRLDIAKTTNVCSGHFPITKEKFQMDVAATHALAEGEITGAITELSQNGLEYDEPYIEFLVDYSSAELGAFAQAIRETEAELSSRYPNFRVDVEQEQYSIRGEHDIREITLRPRISVSPRYLQEHQLPTFEEIEAETQNRPYYHLSDVGLGITVSLKDIEPNPEELASLSRPALYRALVEKHGPYFNSGEPEKILKEYYQTLQSKIDKTFPRKS